jgi:pyridoxamine 5'-phosphate oxidase
MMLEHPGDPFALFTQSFAAAKEREPFEANAMSLATVDARGRPSVRIVLLKGADASGFVFFTNYESRKGKELDSSHFGALCFHWPKGEEQIRIEGLVTRVSTEESDAYFASRPRGSQLGAIASDQSRPLASRLDLEARMLQLESAFEGRHIPRPSHWGGYRLVPDMFEFWYGRKDRLHDRFRYELAKDGSWGCTRLNP